MNNFGSHISIFKDITVELSARYESLEVQFSYEVPYEISQFAKGVESH